MDGVDTDERRLWYGHCSQCERANHDWAWCNPCDQKALVDKFATWSTGNKDLDSFIQETQKTANSYCQRNTYLEFISYDRFTDVSLLEDGFGRVSTAIWLDGERVYRQMGNNQFVKGRSKKRKPVFLEFVFGSVDDFIKKLHYYRQFRKNIYGVTHEPGTKSYALVLRNDTKRHHSNGYCRKCKKNNHSLAWCNSCDRKALVNKFGTWKTGNKDLDQFIQETQRNATKYAITKYKGSYLESIPYDRFKDVKFLARGGFSKVFTATWLDGRREVIKDDEYKWTKRRTGPFGVILKMMDNINLDEIKSLYYFSQLGGCLPLYGITKDPKTMKYALILQHFSSGDLRRNLVDGLSNKLTWNDKLKQLKCICMNLKDIHDEGYIHGDIHSGNILLDGNACWLADFGLTRSADDLSGSIKAGTYGIVPYMAPELFRGEPHSKASDIYAFGVIMSEYASNVPAFYDRNHDIFLQLKIINGLRPEVPPETPECYNELMDRCLSGNPPDRPSANELYVLFRQWRGDLCDTNEAKRNKDTNMAKQFAMADKQPKPKQSETKHPGAIYTSRLITYASSLHTVIPDSPFGTSELQIIFRSNDKRKIEDLQEHGKFLCIFIIGKSQISIWREDQSCLM